MRRVAMLAVAVLLAGAACVPDPGTVVPFDGIEQISASPSMYSCLVTTEQTVACWGLGKERRNGSGAGPGSDHPVAVPGLDNVVQVESGGLTGPQSGHVCALKSDGTVWCYGTGVDGQLGHGSLTGSDVPVQAVGVTNAVQIATAGRRTCALLADATVTCWGATVPTPTAVPGLSDVVDIDMTAWALCHVTTSGDATCEGLDAVGSAGFSGATEIAGGNNVVCAVLADTTVECLGNNIVGQLGDGTTTTSWQPVAVSGLSGVAHVAASEAHACASLLNGEVWCWGYNGHGEIGGGGTDNALVPQQVAGVAGATDVSVGDHYSCAQIADTAKCWGINTAGQLGGGFETDRSGPVIVAAHSLN